MSAPVQPSDRSAAILEAQQAFEIGDFGEARRLARSLGGEGADPATREAAQVLLERMRNDPLVPWLTVACLVFLGLVLLLTLPR